jgi:hypothetical protein
LEPRFAWPLGNASGDDYHPATQVDVVSGAHRQRMRERHGVKNIVCFSLRAGTIEIHENNLPADTIHDQGETPTLNQRYPAR